MALLHAFPSYWRCVLRSVPSLFIFLLSGYQAGQPDLFSRLPAQPRRGDLAQSGPSSVPPLDPYEPNDGFHQATDLNENAESKYGYLWPQGDEDWFWFSVPAGGAHRLEVWLDSVPPGLGYQLAVYGPDGSQLETALSTENDGAYISLLSGTGGAYRARVWSSGEGHAWDAFRIRARVTPVPSADLQLGRRVRTLEVPYRVHIFEFVVRNLGPDPAPGIILSDALPPGMVFGGVTGPGGWGCDHQNDRVICRHPAPISPGERLPTVTVRLYPFHHWGWEIENTARVYSMVFDPDQDNNRVP